MRATASTPFAAATGVWCGGADGKRYLDAACGLWHPTVGHGHPAILAAARRSFPRPDRPGAQVAALERRLAELAPGSTPRVLLDRGGRQSAMSAISLVRRHWERRGETRRTLILSRARSPGGDDLSRNLRDAVWVEDSLSAMCLEVERRGPERIAAIIVEPVVGGWEMRGPAPGYLEGLAELCLATGALLVVDASICAFGLLGTWFGIERWGLEPDLIVFADGVTGGYVPLGGVMLSEDVAATCLDTQSEPGWTRTPPVHPAAAAAALANLAVLEDEGLLTRGWELEGELADILAPLAALPATRDVRAGTGLIAGIHLDPELDGGPAAVVRAVRERGVIVAGQGPAIVIAPPLAIEREHLYLLADALQSALCSLA